MKPKTSHDDDDEIRKGNDLREYYRKRHLGFHHSPNMICLSCIKIGNKEARAQTRKDEIEWLKFQFNRFDIITNENKRAEKVRALFLSEITKRIKDLEEKDEISERV